MRTATPGTTIDDARKALQPIVKAHRLLAEAKTLEDFLQVENLAQRARDFAKAAGLGRRTMNEAARIMLDARRHAGLTLIAMKERGELATRGDAMSQRGTSVTLDDLGLSRNQSSRYQQEASVPDDQYREWVENVCSSDEGQLTASGLRSLAKTLAEPEAERTPKPVDLMEAADKIRSFIENLRDGLGTEGRQLLPDLLRDIVEQYNQSAERPASLESIGIEVTGDLPELTPDCMWFAGGTAGDLIEIRPSRSHPGYFYVAHYTDINNDNGQAVYVRRPIKLAPRLLTSVLKNVFHFDRATPWRSEPAPDGEPWYVIAKEGSVQAV